VILAYDAPRMNYLYGDSSASRLKSNFLELLRDAIDFCVFVLQADAKMKAGRAQIRMLGEKADAETARLERFIASVTQAVKTGDHGESDSPTAKCAARLETVVADVHQATLDALRKSLAEAIARIEAEEAAGRDECVVALGRLLAPHDPPEGTNVLKLAMGDDQHYQASLSGTSPPELVWKLDVAIPDGHAWASPMRIERLIPHLEIKAPALAGWITKEVKRKPQRIERLLVKSIVDDGSTLRFELRGDATPETGFDFSVDVAHKNVTSAARIGPSEDASVGPFDLIDEDVPVLVDLATKLRASLAGLERKPNVKATFEKGDFRALPSFVDFIVPFIEVLTPIVTEIAKRSLTPNELVLRRPLGNDRREELFVSKATLREKLAVLPDDLRVLFDPLELGPSNTKDGPKRGPANPASADKPAVRSEIPPSVPPPPRTSAPPPPLVPKAAPVPNTTAPVTQFAPLRSSPPPPPAPNEKTRTLQPPEGAPPPRDASAPLGDVEELSSDALLETVPESARELTGPSDGTKRNEELVGALKKIHTLSKNGRADDAYREYAALFSSDAFGRYRPADRRHALRMMVLAKTHPAAADQLKAAHRAALARIEALVATESEAQDQELLGLTHLALGDEKAAAAAFQAGLTLERAKNPQSELVATLMRRISQL
jgi:hypothetical protein